MSTGIESARPAGSGDILNHRYRTPLHLSNQLVIEHAPASAPPLINTSNLQA